MSSISQERAKIDMAKKTDLTVRSSAAEYLTFIASTGDNPESFEVRYEDENIWLSQRMMAELYDVDVRTINEHIQTILHDGELTEASTIRKFRIVQIEGNRQVQRNVIHYNLQMIIAVGFKVNNPRAVQFRKWAGQIACRRRDGSSVLTVRKNTSPVLCRGLVFINPGH